MSLARVRRAMTLPDDVSTGLWLSGLGGVLGIGAGILTLRDAPAGGDIADDVEAPAAVS